MEEGAMRVIGQHQAHRAVVALSILGLVAAASIASGIAIAHIPSLPELETPPPVDRVDDLRARLVAVDEALARKDVSRAIYLWRDAYGLALGLRRWDAMAAVGDVAMRIDATTSPLGRPIGFRAEARQAYLRALVDAHAAGEREAIGLIADAFAALGDARMAAQAHALQSARAWD
jgi:hypothetical protein